jgi:long-chain acyl-CoA synthetase
MTQQVGTDSVLGFLTSRSAQFADRVALSLDDEGKKNELTYGQLHDRARNLASYLIEHGLQNGERVALLCESRPEWGICLFGTMRSGAILVPLDIKLTEAELRSILSDAAPSVILVSSHYRDKIKSILSDLPSVRNVFTVDSGSTDDEAPSIDALQPKNVIEGVDHAADEVALVVYTSGTTGSPKGVMTTFGNLRFQVESFKDMIDLTEEDHLLSILPLNHLFELTGGVLGALNYGGAIHFCDSLRPQEIMKSMRENGITKMVAVPLFFKTLKSGLEREIKKKDGADWQMFQMGFEKAAALPLDQRRQMFAAIHQGLGGKLRVLVCGGAPLDLETATFFDRLGLHILQGYGLTETSPVICGNSIKKNKLGSVGAVLKGAELRIDKRDAGDTEGEILTRGPHVMKGYYKRDDQTKEVIDTEGWFHTGDLGHVDEDGFLYITGRLKNLIVLGGGKKVFPEEVEAALSAAPSVKELCVLSRKLTGGHKEGTEEVCAVVVPADDLQKKFDGNPQGLLQAVTDDLDKLSKNLATYKRPSSVLIHPGDFEKTATRKIKRPVVNQWVKDQN